MATFDANGKPWKRLSDTRVGDDVTFDSGFTCLTEGDVQPVHRDDRGLYVLCREGHHYLEGQLDHKHGTDALIGVYPA